MNCVEFLDGNLSEQIDASLASPIELLVFMHLPKTGGTSLQRDLNFAFPNGIHVPYQNKDKQWQDALSRLKSENPGVVRGHIYDEHVRELETTDIPFRTATFLRHPRQRLVSDFLWRNTLHRDEPEKFNHPGSFGLFCQRMGRNVMTEWLVGECESTSEALEKVANRFWFVGLTEFYHVCQAVMMAALNVEYRIRPRKNVTQKNEIDVAQIDDRLLDIALENMTIDLAIYDLFYSKWVGKINEAVELLMNTN